MGDTGGKKRAENHSTGGLSPQLQTEIRTRVSEKKDETKEISCPRLLYDERNAVVRMMPADRQILPEFRQRGRHESNSSVFSVWEGYGAVAFPGVVTWR